MALGVTLTGGYGMLQALVVAVIKYTRLRAICLLIKRTTLLKDDSGKAINMDLKYYLTGLITGILAVWFWLLSPFLYYACFFPLSIAWILLIEKWGD